MPIRSTRCSRCSSGAAIASSPSTRPCAIRPTRFSTATLALTAYRGFTAGVSRRECRSCSSPTSRRGSRERLLLLFHRAAERQRHRALALGHRFAALFGEFREFVALECRFGGIVAERHPLALRIDAHDAHEQLLAGLKRLRWIRTGRHADLGVGNQTGESRLELYEDAGRAAMIDSRFDDLPDRIALSDVLPWIADRDFAQRQRETLLRRIDFAHPAGDLGADRDRRVALFDAERKLRVMHESIDTRLELDEETEVCRAHDRSGELRADRKAIADVGPRIGLLIFHRERDSLAIVLDFDHLHTHLLSDRYEFFGIGDTPAAHL